MKQSTLTQFLAMKNKNKSDSSSDSGCVPTTYGSNWMVTNSVPSGKMVTAQSTGAKIVTAGSNRGKRFFYRAQKHG